jgi:mitogen-activated protein kinase kinase kinase
MAVKRVETPQTASDRADSRQLEMVEALKFERETLKV